MMIFGFFGLIKYIGFMATQGHDWLMGMGPNPNPSQNINICVTNPYSHQGQY